MQITFVILNSYNIFTVKKDIFYYIIYSFLPNFISLLNSVLGITNYRKIVHQ